MSDLQYRSEDQRVADHANDLPERHVISGDPFRPRTEAQRVLEEEYEASHVQERGGLLRHPETGHLIGVESAPLPAPVGASATIASDKTDRRRNISVEEAAIIIRADFVPVSVDPEIVRQEEFLTSVAGYLNADPNPDNLKQISDLLGKADVELPDHEYPKMLYSRTIPDEEYGFETHTSVRHDHVGVIIHNEDDAKKLGSGWVENPAELPARKSGEVGKFERSEKKDKPSQVASADVDPVGWDEASKTVKNVDGTLNVEKTNAERAKRGHIPMGPM